MSNKIISVSTLKTLLLRSERLRRLEEGGVDNWSDYNYSLNIGGSIKDWYKDVLPELIDDFVDS